MARTLGASLKQIRICRGFPQASVSASLKISVSTLSKYENDSLEPNVRTMIKLALLYKVSIDQLIGYYDKKHPSKSKGAKYYSDLENCLLMLGE